MITLNDRHRATYRGYTVQLHGTGPTSTYRIIDRGGEIISLVASLEIAERVIDGWLNAP